MLNEYGKAVRKARIDAGVSMLKWLKQSVWHHLFLAKWRLESALSLPLSCKRQKNFLEIWV